MMITLKKEDFMALPKERLAEMLVEMFENEKKLNDEIVEMSKNKQGQQLIWPVDGPYTSPSKPIEVWYDKTITGYYPPCFYKDGICINPAHDCINCPRPYGSSGTYSTTTDHATIVNHGSSESSQMSQATSQDVNSEFIQYTSEARQD